MNTNDIFNFRRFGKYFTSDLRNGWAGFGLSMLTLAILPTIITYAGCIIINLLTDQTWNGPDIGMRAFVFFISMLCVIATGPVKCFGKLTERQSGSFWILVPASKMEKFISMIIITTIIIPVLSCSLYIGIDALVCVIDGTCGLSLASGCVKLVNIFRDIESNMAAEATEELMDFFSTLSNPCLYLDDLFGMTLPFLLGAIVFKKGKTAKTFLCLVAFSALSSMLLSPIMMSTMNLNEIIANVDNQEAMKEMLSNSSIFKHMGLFDTISDTVVNLALLAGIWFRIKTLKH